MQIFIKWEDGRTHTLQADPFDSVAEVKERAWALKARGGSSGGGSSPNIRLFFSENYASQVRQGDGAASSSAHDCTLLIPMD